MMVSPPCVEVFQNDTLINTRADEDKHFGLKNIRVSDLCSCLCDPVQSPK